MDNSFNISGAVGQRFPDVAAGKEYVDVKGCTEVAYMTCR